MFRSIFTTIFREQCFMPLLSGIPWMYVRYVLVHYAAVCHYRRLCVFVPWVPVLVKSDHRVSYKNITNVHPQNST